MRLIRTLLCVAAFGAVGFFTAAASAAEPKDGLEYLTLPEVRNTDAGNKVEVTEFFAYYCPHCNRFEPLLAAWVRKQGNNIVFKRVHVANGAAVAPQQRLFYTLEALGLLEQYHDKVFAALHVERLRLNTEQAVIDWAAGAGIDRAKFVEAWNSFGVQAKLRRASTMMADYRIDEWPMVAVGGHYMTSPSRAASGAQAAQTEDQMQEAALQVMDYLVAKAKAEKK